MRVFLPFVLIAAVTESACASCLREKLEHFDLRELQSPVAPYENGAVQLRVTNFHVGDGTGEVTFWSNATEFRRTVKVGGSSFTITAYDICPGAIINLMCKVGFREMPCVIAENMTLARLDAFLGVPPQPMIVQDAFAQRCTETRAKDIDDALESLTETMLFMGLSHIEGTAQVEADKTTKRTFYAPDNSRIMLCQVSSENSCPTSRCDEILVPKPRVRPRTLTKPEFVAKFEDGVYSLNNIGAPVSNVGASVRAVVYAQVGSMSLTFAAATPSAPYQVLGGQAMFQIDLRPAHAAMLEAIVAIRDAIKGAGVTMRQDVCLAISYKDPSGQQKSLEFSLRLFHDTPPRKVDMHASGRFYSYCVEDYDKWKPYPRYFIENFQGGRVLAERIITRVNQPVRNRSETYGKWTYSLQQQMEEVDDINTAVLAPREGSTNFEIALFCQRKFLYITVGLWGPDVTGDRISDERTFQLSFDGKTASYPLHMVRPGVYEPGFLGRIDLLRSFLKGKTLVLSFMGKDGKSIATSYDLAGSLDALKPVMASCGISP